MASTPKFIAMSTAFRTDAQEIPEEKVTVVVSRDI